jgi:ferredoxin
VDDRLCIQCGTCVAACAFGALSLNGSLAINTVACMGCGVCTHVCAQQALSLIRDTSKPEPLPLYGAELPERMADILTLDSRS